MIPILFAIGPIKIYTMGVFMVLGLFWALFLLWKTIRMTSFREEDVFDMVTFGIVGGFIWARIIYVLLRLNLFGFDIFKIILINGYPGLSLIGGIAGFFITSYLVARIKKTPYNEIFDHITCSIYIFGIFLSLGGFLSGSLSGSRTDFPVSITYIGLEGKRHLLGLYSALMSLIGAISSYKLLFELRKTQGKKGSVFLYGLWYFGLISLLLDKFKEHNLYLFGLRFDTLIGFIIFISLSLYFLLLNRVIIITTFIKYEKQIITKAKSFIKRKTSSEESSQ